MEVLIFLVVLLLIFVVPTIILTRLIVSERRKKELEKYRTIAENTAKHEETIAENTAKAEETLKKLQTDAQVVSDQLEVWRNELGVIEKRTEELLTLESRSTEIHDLLKNGGARHQALLVEIEQKENEKEVTERELYNIRSDLDLYYRVADFVDFGHFEDPEYLYETSERYAAEIKRVRDKQKQMIKEKRAIELPQDIQVDGSSKKGTAILTGQSKMMLRAFNIECDFLMSKISPSNLDRTLERFEKIAEGLEKSAVSLLCGISTEYIELKMEEAKLVYENKLKKEAEKEEQRIIREQIREEQKARKEYEQAIAEAEREERMYAGLLEKAKKELEAAQENAKSELMAKISLLEDQLKETQEKENRAKSLAEQTRRGHVYVISNIGSFGEDIYKIGLTRRLDPMERVKELGDASVPFPFDVHAIIYSDDAPDLEAKLHRQFNQKRVNVVNRRKEFFQVDLQEIKKAVERSTSNEADFKMTALAKDYYESLRLQGKSHQAA